MQGNSLDNLIAKIAVTDQQTGLFNFAYFKELLERELERTKRYGHSLTIIHIHLKADLSFDSPAEVMEGDELLREFSEFLSVTVRNVDLIGRSGVTDFIVALPETDGKAAKSFVRRVENGFHDRQIGWHDESKPTLAMGGATCPDDEFNLRPLLALAEIAMHKAREQEDVSYLAYNPSWGQDDAVQ